MQDGNIDVVTISQIITKELYNVHYLLEISRDKLVYIPQVQSERPTINVLNPIPRGMSKLPNVSAYLDLYIENIFREPH